MKCEHCPRKCKADFPACFQRISGQWAQSNPGNMQELHAMAHSIKPKFYDGIELDYAHRLATNRIITCNWVLSHTRPSGFRFGGFYAARSYDDFLETPTVLADINPSTLASNVCLTFFPFSSLRMEASLQRLAEDVPLETRSTLEWIRPCTTLTANFYNVTSESGRSTLSFMRSITNQWAMGAELLLEWTDPKNVMADTAFAARYTRYNYCVAASFSRQGIDLSYWQRVHEKIQMATTFAWHRQTRKTIAGISYQWDFNEAVVRGMIDSELSVGFMYYRSLSNIPCGLGLSVLISVPTSRFAFGLKFNLDPSGLRRGD